MQIECDLEESGCEVIGPAPSVQIALELIEQVSIDVAVLDFRLGAETSVGIARTLLEHKIPFLFMTGQVISELPNDLRCQVLLAKPVLQATLIATLEFIFNPQTDH